MLRYVANMGTIPIHVWSARAPSLERPDWLVLDLDPKGAPFTDVVRVAQAVHRLLERPRAAELREDVRRHRAPRPGPARRPVHARAEPDPRSAARDAGRRGGAGDRHDSPGRSARARARCTSTSARTATAGRSRRRSRSGRAGRPGVLPARVAGGHRAARPDPLHDPHRAAPLRQARGSAGAGAGARDRHGRRPGAHGDAARSSRPARGAPRIVIATRRGGGGSGSPRPPHLLSQRRQRGSSSANAACSTAASASRPRPRYTSASASRSTGFRGVDATPRSRWASAASVGQATSARRTSAKPFVEPALRDQGAGQVEPHPGSVRSRQTRHGSPQGALRLLVAFESREGHTGRPLEPGDGRVTGLDACGSARGPGQPGRGRAATSRGCSDTWRSPASPRPRAARAFRGSPRSAPAGWSGARARPPPLPSPRQRGEPEPRATRRTAHETDAAAHHEGPSPARRGSCTDQR